MSIPTVRLRPVLPRLALTLAAAALALPLLAAQAEAHCWRHITNRSSDVWTFRMPNQAWPNPIDLTLQPGQTIRFQYDTNTSNNYMLLTRVRTGNTVAYGVDDGCYIHHHNNCVPDYPSGGGQVHGRRFQEITLNDPADGDIILGDTPAGAQLHPLARLSRRPADLAACR